MLIFGLGISGYWRPSCSENTSGTQSADQRTTAQHLSSTYPTTRHEYDTCRLLLFAQCEGTLDKQAVGAPKSRLHRCGPSLAQCCAVSTRLNYSESRQLRPVKTEESAETYAMTLLYKGRSNRRVVRLEQKLYDTTNGKEKSILHLNKSRTETKNKAHSTPPLRRPTRAYR